MRAVFFCLLTVFLLAACSSPATAPALSTPAVNTPQSTPTPADVFVVKVWVSNPDPLPTETVIIYGTLRRNGQYLNGFMMYATWPDPDSSRGLPNCAIEVIYQRGVCSAYAGKYPSGVYVPVDISFLFRGKTYTGQTGFTPK